MRPFVRVHPVGIYKGILALVLYIWDNYPSHPNSDDPFMFGIRA